MEQLKDKQREGLKGENNTLQLELLIDNAWEEEDKSFNLQAAQKFADLLFKSVIQGIAAVGQRDFARQIFIYLL